MSRPVEIRIVGDASSANRAIGSTQRELRQLNEAGKGLGGLKKGLAGLGAAILAGGALRSGLGLIKDSIGLASDLTETVSKADVVFGKSSEGIQKWAKNTSTALVLPQKDILDLTAGFNLLLGNKGITGKQGRDFSKKLTELAGDLSSFFNVSAQDAGAALTSALKGETDPIEKFGVSLDDATLKAEAYALGLYKGKGPLTANAKAQAAYSAILKQTSKAQGDLLRTQGSASNQMRQFETNIDALKTTLGTAFTPLIEEYLPGVNEWLKGINNEDAANELGDKLLDLGKDFEKAWEKGKAFARDIKSSFEGVSLDSGDLSDTLEGAAGALGSIADGAGAILRAFDGLSPEAKANIGLIIAAGAAFTVAKRNPVVKIGVDLVGGVITEVGSTVAAAVASSIFDNKFAQRVVVTNWPKVYPDGPGGDDPNRRPKRDGGGGLLGALGKGVKGLGLGLLATLAAPYVIDRLPLSQKYKDQLAEGVSAIAVGSSAAWVAGALGVSNPAGWVIGITTAIGYLGRNFDGVDEQTKGVQAQSDYLRNQYNQQVPPLQKDAKNAKESIGQLQGTSSYLATQNEARRQEVLKVQDRLNRHWDRISELYAEGRGYGQNNPSITGPRHGRARMLSEGQSFSVYGGRVEPDFPEPDMMQVNVILDGRKIASYLEPATRQRRTA